MPSSEGIAHTVSCHITGQLFTCQAIQTQTARTPRPDDPYKPHAQALLFFRTHHTGCVEYTPFSPPVRSAAYGMSVQVLCSTTLHGREAAVHLCAQLWARGELAARHERLEAGHGAQLRLELRPWRVELKGPVPFPVAERVGEVVGALIRGRARARARVRARGAVVGAGSGSRSGSGSDSRSGSGSAQGSGSRGG